MNNTLERIKSKGKRLAKKLAVVLLRVGAAFCEALGIALLQSIGKYEKYEEQPVEDGEPP